MRNILISGGEYPKVFGDARNKGEVLAQKITPEGVLVQQFNLGTIISGPRSPKIAVHVAVTEQIPFNESDIHPEVSVVLAHLKNNKYFTTLDLASGFHQIPLHPKDREKTAFSVNNGKYQFNRMPMGLKTSPAIFQRVIDDVLRLHIGIICYVYIDDIIVTGMNLEDNAKKKGSCLLRVYG